MNSIYRFESCAFLPAMQRLDAGFRVRFGGLPQGQYFKRAGTNIFLCESMLSGVSGILHDRIIRKGLAIMGNEEWESQVITTWETCFKATNSYGCGFYKIEAYIREAVQREGHATIEAGSKVLLWTSSRFGDVGITANVSQSATGYDYRVDPSLLTHPRVFDWDTNQEIMYLEDEDMKGGPIKT